MSLGSRIPPKTHDKNHSFYQKLEVSNTTFGTSGDGYLCDVAIPFQNTSLLLLNEETGSNKVVEYSFNGIDLHGELDPDLPTKGITFDNRTVYAIWFRVKSGSSGPLTIRIDAW
jgi:hypothetical protein